MKRKKKKIVDVIREEIIHFHLFFQLKKTVDKLILDIVKEKKSEKNFNISYEIIRLF